MKPAPNVRLAVTNLPENVSLVREVLAGLAGVLPLGDGQLDDVKTVVSEACNNVVLHAYDGARGPLAVEIRVTEGELEVAVFDHGRGLVPRTERSGEVPGIGIPVIHALSDRVEFAGSGGTGTAVRMHFEVPGARALATPVAGDGLEIGERVATSGIAATLVVAPISLAGSVLSRPLTALAARARFSIDRLSDLQLVTDAIVAHVGRSLTGSRLEVGVAVEVRKLELRIGPLRPGMAAQLVGDTAVGGLRPLIETLTDELGVESSDAGEVLTLRMRDAA